ncbi:MAG: FHA domain-containing protein [Pyrinomonadaceae bacterium]
MTRCPTCQTANLDTSRFCDECGTRLVAVAPPPSVQPRTQPDPPAYVPPPSSGSLARPVSVTSIGIPPVEMESEKMASKPASNGSSSGVAHSGLVIERGDLPGTEFNLVNDESTIGRWDADNGIFPDVDLDAHDSDAKVSRRHARIVRNSGKYFIEDLGSTNGTYVNRGRRLLPGNPQPLKDGDEIIVGKTFLRFQISH